MEQLERLLKADIMKLKSTQLLWMHLYIPLLGLAIFLAYYSFTPWNSISKVSGYLQVLCITFPILIGIITSMAADQEYVAGEFQNILAGSQVKSLSIISKFILLIGLGFFSVVLAIIGFFIGFSFIEKSIIPSTTYLVIIGIFIGSNIFLYIFHLFLSLRLSKGISIGIGIVESLISALFLTGMGDGRWPYFPSAWNIRFISSILIRYGNSRNIVDPDLYLGITISLILTILSFIIILIWFSKWEGNRLEE